MCRIDRILIIDFAAPTQDLSNATTGWEIVVDKGSPLSSGPSLRWRRTNIIGLVAKIVHYLASAIMEQ